MNSLLIMAIVIQVIAFAIIVFFIRRLLLNDTMRAIDKIRAVESEVAKKEESVRRQIDEHEQEFARRQEQLEEDLAKRREASEQEVAQMQATIVAEAKSQAQAILDQAENSEAKMREELTREISGKAVDFAGDMIRLIVSETVTDTVNAAFVAEVLDSLEDVDSDSLHVETGNARFVSSHPLQDDQRSKLNEILASKFNIEKDVNEEVDPDILAGLILRLGTLEIDGSLRNRLAQAATQIKKAASTPA